MCLLTLTPTFKFGLSFSTGNHWRIRQRSSLQPSTISCFCTSASWQAALDGAKSLSSKAKQLSLRTTQLKNSSWASFKEVGSNSWAPFSIQSAKMASRLTQSRTKLWRCWLSWWAPSCQTSGSTTWRNQWLSKMSLTSSPSVYRSLTTSSWQLNASRENSCPMNAPSKTINISSTLLYRWSRSSCSFIRSWCAFSASSQAWSNSSKSFSLNCRLKGFSKKLPSTS